MVPACGNGTSGVSFNIWMAAKVIFFIDTDHFDTALRRLFLYMKAGRNGKSASQKQLSRNSFSGDFREF
jgi:hypothetical protein